MHNLSASSDDSMNVCPGGARKARGPRALRSRLLLGVLAGLLAGARAFATSVVPLSDTELYERADTVVHGVVLSSEAVEDVLGQPETVSVIRALRVLKGKPVAELILRQAGGVLPDGRFFHLFGRPEYVPGREVVVFAIDRPEGDFQTAELLLGKYEVQEDERGTRFAVPDLAAGVHPGVTVLGSVDEPDPELPFARFRREPATARVLAHARPAPRELAGFLDFLGAGATAILLDAEPAGELSAVVHEEIAPRGFAPYWGHINNSLWRWNNGATAAWTLEGTANMTGGGIGEAEGALGSWSSDPTSAIDFTSGSSPSIIHMSATTSPCGWSTCISGGGVIGCGGPSGGGSNVHRGDSYHTITRGEVWLRCYANSNGFGSVITQSVLTHEIGHALGLGHSDQNVSPHDTCRGDEGAAIMRSSAQSRTTLGSDDRDSIRWIYGDGGNSCTNLPGPTLTEVAPGNGSAAGGISFTLTGTNFQAGAAVSIGGVAAVVTSVSPTSISARTGAHAVGTAGILVTNPDSQSATLPAGYFYDFADVTESHPFYDYVINIYRNGVTGGCSASLYCPDSAVTREQMAVFLLRAKHGNDYVPPPADGDVFADVPASRPMAPWIERLYAEGVTAGCSVSPLLYCPTSPITRAHVSVFLLRALNGEDYDPPAASGVFDDLPAWHPMAAWVEELSSEGITAGCGGGNFCPNAPVSRGQMAVFLVATFGLP